MEFPFPFLGNPTLNKDTKNNIKGGQGVGFSIPQGVLTHTKPTNYDNGK